MTLLSPALFIHHTACLLIPFVKAVEKVFGEGVKAHLLMIFKDASMLFPQDLGVYLSELFQMQETEIQLVRKERSLAHGI